MFVLSGFSFPVPGCVTVISKPAKVDLAILFQCKCSGTGQNETKLSWILLRKGKYFPANVYVGNWTLSSFIPEGPQTKMGHGWSIAVRSSLHVQRRA